MNPVQPLTSMLILFSYLCLSLPSGLFPLGFPTKNLYAFFIITAHINALFTSNMFFNDGSVHRLLTDSKLQVLRNSTTVKQD